VKVSGIWRALHNRGAYWAIEARTLRELSTLLENPSKG